jgi:NAD-dependent deacetylase
MGVLEDLALRWSASERVVVLTGAGISTASGVPDFRSPGGRWSNYQPVPLPAFLASEESQKAYWRYKGETWQVISKAEPNAAHRALVEMAGADAIRLLVTQNVDGLHERSGFPADRLVAIHGTDSVVSCFSCGRREPREAAQAQWESGVAVPTCPECGGPWKPATISFGQALVEEDLERAFSEASGCDLFVAVGTSLVVSPVNQMFLFARQSGAPTAILTASETPFDRDCDWKLEDPVELSLPRIAQEVCVRRPR